MTPEKAKFPKTLYVSETFKSNDVYDAYDSYTDCEEDDTIAVYELKMVARVKIKKEVILIDEDTFKNEVLERTKKNG